MSKPFTVTEDENAIEYNVRGFWTSTTVRIYKPTQFRDKYLVQYGIDVRDENGVESDLEAMKNLHAALGHAIETLKGFESE